MLSRPALHVEQVQLAHSGTSMPQEAGSGKMQQTLAVKGNKKELL